MRKELEEQKKDFNMDALLLIVKRIFLRASPKILEMMLAEPNFLIILKCLSRTSSPTQWTLLTQTNASTTTRSTRRMWRLLTYSISRSLISYNPTLRTSRHISWRISHSAPSSTYNASMLWRRYLQYHTDHLRQPQQDSGLACRKEWLFRPVESLG